MQRSIQRFTICCVVILALMVDSLQAALTAEQRKDLKEIGSQLSKIASLVSKKKY